LERFLRSINSFTQLGSTIVVFLVHSELQFRFLGRDELNQLLRRSSVSEGRGGED
jgi:hypothetical protein